jgi:hypothetical protein
VYQVTREVGQEAGASARVRCNRARTRSGVGATSTL